MGISNADKEVIDTVQVALRIRPLVESELARGCESCIESFPSQAQVQIKGLAFTYNNVFPPEVSQRVFYETAVSNLVKKLFQGYNVTILAYGQTGSGKTYSMGTCYTGDGGESYDAGVIPQSVDDIFNFANSNAEEYDFKVTVSFMELYKEQLYDLLSNKPRDQTLIDIREDQRGIILPGLTEEKVSTAEETIGCLIRGSSGRATGATAMNAQSSRSHAIFTIQIIKESKENKNEITTSKFHLVDLAGSERSKKTKATGDRFKEGVKINQGLLALGNVISALGGDQNRGFICYRESKLTRLLQDSLGGNSMTLMVACVSPADYNLDETISTLRYADRARQIRNKPIINQDAKGAEIIRLNNLVQQLRLQVNEGGGCSYDGSNMAEELQKEKLKYAELLQKYDVVVEKNKNLTKMWQESMTENTNIYQKVLMTEMAKEKVDRKLAEITEECNQTINNLTKVGDHSTKEEAIQSMCEIRSRIVDLQSDQNKCGQLFQQLIHDDAQDNESDAKNGSDAAEEYADALPELNESDINEKEEAHAMDQYSKGHQLQELARSLALKMRLAEKMSANNEDLSVHNQNVQDYQEKINQLEHEREKLAQQLKMAQHKSKLDPKVVDERRSKIQVLESEISNLKKKCKEQAAFLKMKEKNDLKIVQLNREIQQIKSARVKLIKTMAQDNTRFREWKIQNERKIAKLCDQDRKRQNAMTKMEIMHFKQQNVLKRKMEEAVAINKRLKEALERQTAAQKHRGHVTSKVENGRLKGEDTTVQWIGQELDVVSWVVAAQRLLEGLIEDRTAFSRQLEQRKAHNPKDPGLCNLEKEIKQRSAQIAELQEKILAGDQENKSKTRWDAIQTMSEAKIALKYLFEMIIEVKREIQNYKYKNIQEDTKLEELKNLHQEALDKVNELERALKETRFRHKKEFSELERQNEERMCTLLKQLNEVDISSSDEQLQQRMAMLQDLYQTALKSKETLEQENQDLQQQIYETKAKQQNKAQRRNNGNGNVVVRYLPEMSEDEVDLDDSDNDPDWHKTPAKKMSKSRVPLKDINETQTVKRSSDGQTKCSCKGNCANKMCSCKKFNLSCSSRCKCNDSTCVNKDNSDVENQCINPNVTYIKDEADLKNINFLEPNSEAYSRQNSTESDEVVPSKMKKNRSFFYGERKTDV